jgi:CBS domain-containing protein
MVDTSSPHRVRMVRVRKTIKSSLGTKTSLSVLCAERGCSVDLPDCLRCGEFAWMEADPATDRLCIHCGDPDSRRTDEVEHDPAIEAILERPLSSVMSSKVYCVTPETPIDAVASTLLERDIGAVPVVDREGRPLGVVSKTDIIRALFGQTRPDGASWLIHEDDSATERLLRFLAAGGTAEGTAEDMMMPAALTLPETSRVKDAVDLMSSAQMHRVVAVSEEGRVVGVFSTLDLTHLLASKTT